MTAVWKSVRDVDDDSNGFLNVSELEACFKEHFAFELDGNSLVYLFRRFSTDHDKNLVNYRKIKAVLYAKTSEVRDELTSTHSKSI